MSGLELLVDEIDGRLHAAVIHKTVLTDLYADPIDKLGAWGALYLGKVAKIDKNLDAAIIDLGNGVSGFLPAKHVHYPGADRSETRTGISELLSPGQMVMVQLKSEARNASEHEQHKLARLTTKLNIQGQHLVYCPIANQVTISRQLVSDPILALTAKLKGKGGWIIMASSEGATEDEIHEETRRLQEEWHVILSEKDASDGKPRLLKTGPNALYRALFDYSEKAFEHIHIGNKNLFDMMASWCEKYSPALATSKRLRLFKPEKTGQKLFDIHDIYSEIESLSDSYVALPSGGSIIIEPTHALIVIDVNQGSSAHAAHAHTEAAAEVARQIRLRNLSGAILIDFMSLPRTERPAMQEVIEKSFADDHASPHMHGFTRLGIAEITRKRRTAMYFEKIKVRP